MSHRDAQYRFQVISCLLTCEFLFLVLKFILSAVVKGKSRRCCCSQGESSLLSFLQFWGWIYSSILFIFGGIFIFGVFSIFQAVLIFGVIFFLLIFILEHLHFWDSSIFEVVFHLVSFKILGHLYFLGWANYPLPVPLSCPDFGIRPMCLGLTYQLREWGQDGLWLNIKKLVITPPRLLLLFCFVLTWILSSQKFSQIKNVFKFAC